MGEGAINPATSDEENEKQDILLKFEALKSQLKELLDKNETLSEQEQLPISEFDLDSENTEKLYKKSAEEREKTQVDYKTKISKWDRMKDVIIEKCWDVMEFKGKCLKAIGNSFLVENFALPYTDPEAIAKLKHSVQIRELDFSISKDQSTKPWAHVTKRKDNFGRAVSKSQGKSLKVPKTFEDELDILAPPSHGPPGVFQEFRGCSQLQLNSFLAAAREFPSLMEATVQLRKNFNARFDEMFDLKEKELQEMSEKHERLRTIQYERAASCKIPSEESTPQDPVWTQIEKSHLILEVAPHEIRSKPPEQKKTIYTRKQKTDESKLQLQYATDSFRENALVKMMDGVLEVRWEDLLKKDVPPLEEVLSKIPEELQEEREKAVEDWKRKVKELEEGRKRYKKQIDEEWLQIIENLQINFLTNE
nr:PREDICTED: cilia- and flagella-associated protein 43-like [Bemisia tabaci]